jgi:hypothetical protein
MNNKIHWWVLLPQLPANMELRPWARISSNSPLRHFWRSSTGEGTAVNCRGREAVNGSGEVDVSAAEPHRA